MAVLRAYRIAFSAVFREICDRRGGARLSFRAPTDETLNLPTHHVSSEQSRAPLLVLSLKLKRLKMYFGRCLVDAEGPEFCRQYRFSRNLGT